MGALKVTETILPRPKQAGMVGDGFRVYNYFPSGYRIRELISPFLMLDFNPEYNFGPSDHPRGVGAHPHKGFETVTIAYKGHVAHHDSKGNSGVIHPGDVQWMTAGGGILHKEYHEEEFSKTGGPFQMVQLWVNLPMEHKLVPAHYQAIESSQMGKFKPDDKGSVVNVIAGQLNEIKGPADTYSQMNVYDARLAQGAHWTFEIPSEHNCGILIVEGDAVVNGNQTNLHDFVLFANQGETIDITTSKEAVLLVLSGVPIREPIAQYGPFVMNTQAEIYEAIEEYNAGKFGEL